MTSELNMRKPLRLWPGVVAVGLQWFARFVLPVIAPDAAMYGLLAGVFGGGLTVLAWWLFFSRAPWLERIGALVAMVAAVVATTPFLHESIRTGMMGMMFRIYVIPPLCLALVAWAVTTQYRSPVFRGVSLVAAMLLACGAFTILRTDGVTGAGESDVHWRWTPTAEQRLLARTPDPVPALAQPSPAAAASSAASTATPVDRPSGPAASPAGPAAPAAGAAASPRKEAPMETTVDASGAPAADPGGVRPRVDWPGFRGPYRDAVVRGLRLETDWSRKPPVRLWQRPIGPGWSSFAVRGDLVYTQEQRGEHEVVSCYRLSTGEPVWRHQDAVRFWESNGGAGPRGTPAVSGGRVYTVGATGIVNALDAATGAVAWSRNAAADTGAQMPGWGFASSPLVLDDVAIVAASGRLVAYDAATGNPRWVRQTRGGGYSSPHLVTIDGVPQILLLSGGGATGVAPGDGAVLWEHGWQDGVGIVQPAMVSDRDLLISGGDMMGGVGIRRIAVARGGAGWNTEERWTTRGLKPYFNDFVVHEGHAYGFDGTILSCIGLEDGARKWKGGRYGAGQMLLLQDQDLLLVLSEEGELALVRATADQYSEVTRFPAIEGKTWNHPALAGDILLVRNGEQMAAFRLPLAGR